MTDVPPAATHWVPLESNPDWSSKAGLVTSRFAYSDIYGLDEELLSLVPQPVKAVILLFPITEPIDRKMQEEVDHVRKHGQHWVDSNVIWIKQTIGNACGTMGLLHAIMNAGVPILPNSPIKKYIDACRELTPLERSGLLETTTIFSEIHAESASAGQTAPPEATARVDLHFTCFVSAPDPIDPNKKRLIELDGRRDSAFDRGECEDLLKDAARVIKECYVEAAASVQFSMLALAPPPEF
ncbi:hypothetical protein QCA50_010663 [Cerrena zonata]|uniref:Ubiquitin carboxyl-terminal hydrolase n=1 Tax=Cerrena zonata TaxID=2478898 RepID=A0AAW0G832_9APHY